MLLSQRKVLSLFVFMSLFLSSCVPELSPNESAASVADVTIPVTCFAENGQTFIASNQAYCFAYPSGYIVENLDPESLTLSQASVGGIPATTLENPSSIDDILQAMPGGTTLQIRYEDRHMEDRIEDLVRKHSDDFYTPWIINGTKAILARTARDNAVSYTIHAKNGDFYYEMMFSSSAGLTGNCTPAASDLEELFFLVAATFTFLN